MSTARPDQAEVIAYDGGRVAVAAVPGAGKTYVLKELAARLIEDRKAAPSQLLMLTYMRTGAMNLRERIQLELQARGRSASGLRVMTIHAFCHQLLQRHGAHLLGNGRQLVSQGEQRMRLVRGLEQYLADRRQYEAWMDAWRCQDWLLRNPDKIPVAEGWSRDAAASTVSAAKAYGIPMADAAAVMRQLGFDEVAYVAEYYDREMQQRDQLDYDDLIALSIRLFEDDPALLQRYQRQYRYVLEDEAQDSTYAQQRLIGLLTKESGNLLRVGDTNQAILSTFTFNDPQYFRDFLHSARKLPLEESGRSARRIQEMANRLVAIGLRHPDRVMVNAFEEQMLRPSSSGQQNPADEPGAIRFVTCATVQEQDERLAVAVQRRLQELGPTDGHGPVIGILTRYNDRANEIGKRLQALGIEVWLPTADDAESDVTLLILADVFRFLCLKFLPGEESLLLVLRILDRLQTLRGEPLADYAALQQWSQHLSNRCLPFVYPDLPESWGGAGLPPRPLSVSEGDYLKLLALSDVLRELLSLRHRPVVELLAWACERLFDRPAARLAGHQLAMALRREYYRQPDMDLDQACDYVETLCRQRRSGLLRADVSDQPASAPVMVATVHKSKGMEFDTVYVVDVTAKAYNWQVEDKVSDYAIDSNRRQIAIRAIEARGDGRPWTADEVVRQAAYDEVGESLRLLYVAITRAKRRLILSTTTAQEGTNRRRPPGWPPHVQQLRQEFGKTDPA
jgi:DNA helicase-2/ATP-dependent DNA helicase PcrA